jgi:glutathionylspermidine amidase/synthetase
MTHLPSVTHCPTCNAPLTDEGIRLHFGAVLGVANGVPCYSSLYRMQPDGHDYFKRDNYDEFRSFIDDPTISKEKVYCGFKYQCVEFARRYLILTHGVSFPSIDMAWQIFELDSFCRASDLSQPVPITKYKNGSSEAPRRGKGHI